jgi:hypothetical protein
MISVITLAEREDEIRLVDGAFGEVYLMINDLPMSSCCGCTVSRNSDSCQSKAPSADAGQEASVEHASESYTGKCSSCTSFQFVMECM